MNKQSDNGNLVGRVPSPGVPATNEADLPRRLRRLHRVWPDREGNISYLLTICVDQRRRVLDNEKTFQRFVAFLLDSPKRYCWFGRRFVIMPDHIHLIALMGHDAVRIGEWIKALKGIVAGLSSRTPGEGTRPTGVSDPGTRSELRLKPPHEFIRVKRSWKWQDGFHDHKFRSPESESRKWEYICLNPVRYGLVERPEQWAFGGEIFYDPTGKTYLVRGTPPLLTTGLLMEDDPKTPGEGTRPTKGAHLS